MSSQKSRTRKKNRDKNKPGQEAAADFISIILLLVIVALFFLDILLRGQVFFAGDIMTVYTPWQKYNQEALSAGRIPLWSDDFFSGFPLFAESQGALFYFPTRLVYLLVPAVHAFSYDVLLHFFMAGCFQYFFARTLRLSPPAGFLSAAAFAFSGLFLSLPINFTIFRSIVWIPLIFAFLTLGARSSSLFFPLLAALSMVCQMAGGSLQITWYTILALIPYVFFLVLSPGRKDEKANGIPFLQFLLTLMLAGGLYAFQLIPTMELSFYAWRGTQAGYDIASSFSFHPLHMIDILFPTFYGIWANGSLLPVVPPAPNFFPYIGLAPLFLVPVGLASKKRGMAIMIILTVLFAMMALGKFGIIYPAIYQLASLLDKFRAPDRFWCIAVFSATLLAGYGYDYILQSIRAKKPAVTPSLAGFTTIIFLLLTILMAGAVYLPGGQAIWSGIINPVIGVFFSTSNPPFNPDILTKWREHLSFVFLQAFIVITLFNLALWLFARKGSEAVLTIFMVLITVGDLYFISLQVPALKTTTKEFFTVPPRTAQVLLRDGDPNRFYMFGARHYAHQVFDFPSNGDDTLWYNGGGSYDLGDYLEFREELPPNIFMHWNLQSANGFASLFLENYFKLEGAASDQLLALFDANRDVLREQNIPGADKSPAEWARRTLLIDLMAARYVLTPEAFAPTDRFSLIYEDPEPEDGQMRIYANRKALPRAWISMPSVVLAETKDTMRRLYRGDIDPRDTLILDPLPANRLTYPQGINTGSAQIISDKNKHQGNLKGGALNDEQVLIKVSSSYPAYLFLADTYYPGWTAEINGRKVDRIYRAFGYFRAIEIPAGEHVVSFQYKPLSFQTGKILSGITLTVSILLLLVQLIFFSRLQPKETSEN